MGDAGTKSSVDAEPSARWEDVWLIWLLAIVAGLAGGLIASRFLWDSGTATALALQADRQSGELQIRWDPRSTAAKGAQRAVVTLTGETGSVELVCDRTCLARGSLSYPWQESTADIGMKLLGKAGGTAQEHTRLVANTPNGSSAPDAGPTPP
ncbi:MAG: hypothetical protein LLG20_02905 [Acidobacteriales bacterium]|nr:hypothetical protein [Terriglobales bacterium]